MGARLGDKASARGQSAVIAGRGLTAKVLQRIKPVRPGGCAAAIDIAMGPENDSPSSMNGSSLGNDAITRRSNAS